MHISFGILSSHPSAASEVDQFKACQDGDGEKHMHVIAEILQNTANADIGTVYYRFIFCFSLPLIFVLSSYMNHITRYHMSKAK